MTYSSLIDSVKACSAAATILFTYPMKHRVSLFVVNSPSFHGTPEPVHNIKFIHIVAPDAGPSAPAFQNSFAPFETVDARIRGRGEVKNKSEGRHVQT